MRDNKAGEWILNAIVCTVCAGLVFIFCGLLGLAVQR
jgi:hypothetical protein